MNKDDIRKDLEEYGIEEILAQYMMNADAEEYVLKIIKGYESDLESLNEENQRLETELMMLR